MLIYKKYSIKIKWKLKIPHFRILLKKCFINIINVFVSPVSSIWCHIVFACKWWRLFQKQVVLTKLDIYISLWPITVFVLIVTGRVLQGEHELITIPEHLNSSPVFLLCSYCSIFSNKCSFVVKHCLSFWPFPTGHCMACTPIYGFWLPLWYL